MFSHWARLVTHSAIERPWSLAPWLVKLLFFQISQQSLIYGYWFQFGGKSCDPWYGSMHCPRCAPTCWHLSFHTVPPVLTNQTHLFHTIGNLGFSGPKWIFIQLQEFPTPPYWCCCSVTKQSDSSTFMNKKVTFGQKKSRVFKAKNNGHKNFT